MNFMRKKAETEHLEVVYDDEVDILTVDVKYREGEDYKESVPIGGFVFDISDTGEILGVEILDFSQKDISKQDAIEMVEEIQE